MSNQTRTKTDDQTNKMFRLALVATGIGMLLSALI